MSSEPVAIIESDDSKVQEPDDSKVQETDTVPRQYSLRERKPVNYRE